MVPGHPAMSTSSESLRERLRRHDLVPKKSLGQNFLVDISALQNVIASAGLDGCEQVLEIGAGPGNLTSLLAQAAREVVAVEIDRRFIPMLTEVQQSHANIHVIQGDILKLDSQGLGVRPGYVVVANLPYYITSAVIRHLLEGSVKPARMVLTVQSEVAERICARPGKLSLLALSVQVYGSPQIGACIPASAFFPTPQVDSTIVTVELFPEPVVPSPLLDLFFRLAKAGFSQKRKTLRNALSAGMHLSPPQTEEKLHTISVDPMRRAETLTLKEWKQLTASWDQ
jgi:16S rRNA (adenine1518-N6/adenine1519-N6)-dimethyltransferase